LASLSEVDSVCSILEREIACHWPELVNRAYGEFRIPFDTVGSAYVILFGRGLAAEKRVSSPSITKTAISFVYASKQAPDVVERIISEKAGLMAKHYNLCDTVGRHGETLVAEVCTKLGYSEVEIRKEKHGREDLGISKRDIDVWARHPTLGYYQNIEVKNRRDTVKNNDLATILETTNIAKSRWLLDVRPALVATFITRKGFDTAQAIEMPVAFSEGVYVPEKHRNLYDELNYRLALNVVITDRPTPALMERVERYIMRYEYKESS
jgi:hypothetical protein